MDQRAPANDHEGLLPLSDEPAANDPPPVAPPIPATLVPTTPVLSYADPQQAASHGNRVLMEQHADGGVSFLIRAPGMLREMASIVSLCLILGVSVILLTATGMLPCGVVVVISIVMLVAMIRAANQPAMIEVRDGVLTQVCPVSLLSPRQQWSADQVKRLRVGWRGVSLRGRAVADLDMTLRNGRTVPLFVGRDKKELEWIAKGLREALRLQE